MPSARQTDPALWPSPCRSDQPVTRPKSLNLPWLPWRAGTLPTTSQTRSLGAQKLAQAQELLRECSLDAWLLAVRESTERPDPNLRRADP